MVLSLKFSRRDTDGTISVIRNTDRVSSMSDLYTVHLLTQEANNLSTLVKMVYFILRLCLTLHCPGVPLGLGGGKEWDFRTTVV